MRLRSPVPALSIAGGPYPMQAHVVCIDGRGTAASRASTPLGSPVPERLHASGNLRGGPIGTPAYTRRMGATAMRNVITVVLPTIDDVLAAIPDGVVSDEPDLRARLRLALLNTQISADAD